MDPLRRTPFTEQAIVAHDERQHERVEHADGSACGLFQPASAVVAPIDRPSLFARVSSD